MGTGCVGKFPIMYLSHKSVLITCYALIMPVIAFGLVGNILSFRIIGYNRSRRNQSSTFFLRTLAITDSLTLVFNSLLVSQQMMLRPALGLHPLNILSLILGSYPACNIRMFANHCSTLISVYIIVLFSIERALVVINPFRWMRFFTVKKAKVAVGALVVTCICVCIPSFFSFRKENYFYPKRLYNLTNNATIEDSALLALAECNENVTVLHSIPDPVLIAKRWQETNTSALTDVSLQRGRSQDLMSEIGIECQSIGLCRIRFPVFKPFMLFYNIALSIVPFIITGICNLIIVFTLRRPETKNLRKSKANEEQQDRQVTKKLIVVSTAFIVLGFPLALYHIITGVMSGSYCNNFWANVLTITITLNSSNYAINFIIYCISEEQFRRLVVTMLMCKRHRLKRLLSYINEPGGKRRGVGPRSGGVPTVTDRKASNPNTYATNNSVTKTKDFSEVSVTDALVHNNPHDVDLDPDPEAAAKKLETAVADYVAARHQREAEEEEAKTGEKPHDFQNCSLVKDDWASELFMDDDDERLRVVMARWSEVAPE